MYRKSLVIKKHKANIDKLNGDAREILSTLAKQKEYKSYRIMLDKYNSLLAKVHVIRRKIENLNNGLPELGRSIDTGMEDTYNSEEN